MGEFSLQLTNHSLLRSGATERRLFVPIVTSAATAKQSISLAAGCQPTDQRRHHRAGSQFVAIVEVFLAKGDRRHALADVGFQRMLDRDVVAATAKTRDEVVDQTNGFVGAVTLTNVSRVKLA